MALPILTTMRRSLWSAVDAWEPFDGLFREKVRAEAKGTVLAADYTPKVANLPALLMQPSALPPTGWRTNQEQEIQYPIDVTVWTHHRSVLDGEWIWEQFNRCLWQSTAPGGSRSYLFDRDHGALDNHSTSLPGAIFVGPDMTRWDWGVVLIRAWTPETETAEIDKAEAI